MKKNKLQISRNTSKHLFLSNLKPDNSNDDKIEDLILSLNATIKSRTNNKLACLNTLEYKLKHIKCRNIISEFEKEKGIKNELERIYNK